MAEKKYYWLKLQKDFFKRHDIKIIKSMPNGKDYVIFYLTLLLESIDHEGALRFSDTIPYNDDMLATITDTNIDIVRSAMKILIELNMIEILDDSTIYLAEISKMIGCENSVAERVRKHRESQKALHCNADVTLMKQKCNTEIELEKEIELEIDIENNGEEKSSPIPSKSKRFIPPTIEEVTFYCQERSNNVNAEKFVDHYTSNGWKVGKNPMKDWKASVRTWEQKDGVKSGTDKQSTKGLYTGEHY